LVKLLYIILTTGLLQRSSKTPERVIFLGKRMSGWAQSKPH